MLSLHILNPLLLLLGIATALVSYSFQTHHLKQIYHLVPNFLVIYYLDYRMSKNEKNKRFYFERFVSLNKLKYAK